ncbi:hypothetical protein HYT59_00975 [Candidatus Woesebacteria bacterium]|nr:hypothetical protein [Candidatus Woesebacteria bacterium]
MSERLQFSTEIERGNEIVNRVAAIERFRRQPDTLDPTKEIEQTIKQMEGLVTDFPVIVSPQNLDELYLAELRQRLVAEHASLSVDLMSETPTFEQVIAYNGIPIEDIESLEVWLAENREPVKEANKRKFERTANQKDRRPVHLGVDELNREASSLAKEAVERVIRAISEEFGVAEAVKMFKRYMDSWETRSFANWISNTVRWSTHKTTYMNEDGVFVDSNEIIRLVGHEFGGHVRHHVVTKMTSYLPSFLKTATDLPTSGTMESVAQHFESRLFTILKENPNFYQSLGFNEPFEDIYQRYLDDKLIADYIMKRFQFGIYTLAKSTQDDRKTQMEKLMPYAIEPWWPAKFINYEKDNWDQVSGRLISWRISELRYVADPVGRIMRSVPADRIEEAERLILTGYWMPQGLEDWVRINLATPSFI